MARQVFKRVFLLCFGKRTKKEKFELISRPWIGVSTWERIKSSHSSQAYLNYSFSLIVLPVHLTLSNSSDVIFLFFFVALVCCYSSERAIERRLFEKTKSTKARTVNTLEKSNWMLLRSSLLGSIRACVQCVQEKMIELDDDEVGKASLHQNLKIINRY